MPVRHSTVPGTWFLHSLTGQLQELAAEQMLNGAPESSGMLLLQAWKLEKATENARLGAFLSPTVWTAEQT